MAFSYPRKQTLLIFTLCAIAVGTVAYYRLPQKQSSNSLQNLVSVQPSASPVALTATDENNNGVADWQEQFSGSAEVHVASNKSKPSTETPEKLTLTAQLGRDFFGQYVNLKKTGLFEDDDTVTLSMQSLVDNAVSSEKPVQYKLSDIRQTKASDEAALAKWTESVSKSFNAFTWSKNEAMLANEALNRQDPAILEKITPIISGYSKIIASLKAIQTPEVVSLEMVDLLNAVSTLKYGAQAMKTFGSDPLKGTIGVRAYSEGSQALVRALQEIDLIVAQEGIVFEINGMVFNTLARY